MTRVMLISEDVVKTQLYINKNINGEALCPAIIDAQEIGLQSTIGSCLYNVIVSMVDDNSIEDEGNADYKYLLDNYIQDYLLYETLFELIPVLSTKICNLGTVVSNDEHISNVTADERHLIESRYKHKADFFRKRLQQYLLNNSSKYPELDECACEAIRANLKSSNSCPIWLGGYRGRKE